MARKKKPSKRLMTMLSRLESGERLCKSLRMKETGETEVLFNYEPSGRAASSWAAARAIREGLVRPVGDGLFGGETSQTWVAA